MKPCSRCLWPMVSGGVCDKCGHVDDELPVEMIIIAVIVAMAVTGLALGICSIWGPA